MSPGNPAWLTPTPTGRWIPTSAERSGYPFPLSAISHRCRGWRGRCVEPTPGNGPRIHLDQTWLDLLDTGRGAKENCCCFCHAAQRALLWGQGMSEARIAARRAGTECGSCNSRAAAAIAFGRLNLAHRACGSARCLQALRRAGFGDDEMRQIAFTAAATDMANRARPTPGCRVRLERIPIRCICRSLRLLINRILQASLPRARTDSNARLDSYARLIQKYAGSPIARS